MIARDNPYCLFLDELNACSQEVQKSFYSLINDKRIAEYYLPEGSVVIGAGNRMQDGAIVKQMSSALLNRMVHIHLSVSHRDWLEWAKIEGVHPYIIQYIEQRPDHLWSQPPKTEESFSTPRSWHIMSDCLLEYGDNLTETTLELLANGCLTPSHAVQFKAFIKQVHSRYKLSAILRGDKRWPSDASERDILYFLAQSFRAQLIKELPREPKQLTESHQSLAHRAKGLLKELAEISLEIAQMVVGQSEREDDVLPSWLMVEVIRDLPRLVERQAGR